MSKIRHCHLEKRLFASAILGAALVTVLSTPMIANASQYESQQAIKDTFSQAGVQGSLTVKDPKINLSGHGNDHRDYMVYVNFYTSSSAMGAGWYAVKNSGSTSDKYDLVYYVTPTIGTNHDLYTSLSVGTTFTAFVQQQTSSSSDCWTAGTYSNTKTYCFPSGSHPAGNVGSIARALKDYSSGSNDMPGYFDVLKVGQWIGASVSYTYFSNASYLNEYKCYSTDTSVTNSYILDKIWSYTGGAQIDNVGSGPSLYTTDDCTTDSPAWTAIGST